MTDELERLQSTLSATSPRAPNAARERAIAEAMAAFDREFQETGDEARQKGRVPKRGTSWIRRFAMPMSRPSLAFAGGAAVVVLAGIVSHQVLLTPRLQPSDMEGAAGDSPALSMGESVSKAPAEPAMQKSLERARQRLAQTREAESAAPRCAPTPSVRLRTARSLPPLRRVRPWSRPSWQSPRRPHVLH